MPAGPRQLLEDRFAQLSADLETLFAESREQTRREYAEQLNQRVRRLRQAPGVEILCDTLADAASVFAEGVMLFRIAGGVARHPRLEVLLEDAPALASAADIRDPLVALATPAEVSAPLAELLGHDESARAHLFPIALREETVALLYCWGGVQGPAIETLTQMTAAVWTAILSEPEVEPEPEAELESALPPDLVNIAPAPAVVVEPAAPRTASRWEELSTAEQQIHLRAQRMARVQVAEMRLQYADAVQAGRTRRDLYGALRQPIDTARAAFRAQFFTCPSMVDYLDLELTRTLAHEDPELLGQSYPGPLV